MNSKAAKELRHQIRMLGKDPTEARYEDRVYGTREYTVPVVAAFNWVRVKVTMPRVTTTLHLGSGRALYKRAKKLYRENKVDIWRFS